MVGTITWFSERYRSKANPNLDYQSRWLLCPEKPEILGILAFDIAKSMSRLISLYRSLSNKEMSRLKKRIIENRGINYLIFEDEGFLLTLACAEWLEDLEHVATTVSQLGQRCADYGLVRFAHVYKDLKNGHVDMYKLNNYGSKEMAKFVAKMERFTSLTGQLYSELEELTLMETSERKLNEWKNHHNDRNTNYDLFDQKIGRQRKNARHLKEISLWNQSYDKIVGIMAKMVCTLYVRICILFQLYISILPSTKSSYKKMIKQRVFSDPTPKFKMCGPIGSPCQNKVPFVRFLSRDNNIIFTKDMTQKLGLQQQCNHNITNHNNKVFQAAPPSTVGGSGLAIRYANVVLLAEKYFYSESVIGEHARQYLYNMLPSSLKAYVRSKLRVRWREIEDKGDELAEGWRKAVEDMLAWLVPVAEDTVTWQAERNMEKQRFDSKPNVLLLQTLHYADLEKTEAVLAEVLVGLSCIYLFENRRISLLEISRN